MAGAGSDRSLANTRIRGEARPRHGAQSAGRSAYRQRAGGGGTGRIRRASAPSPAKLVLMTDSGREAYAAAQSLQAPGQGIRARPGGRWCPGCEAVARNLANPAREVSRIQRQTVCSASTLRACSARSRNSLSTRHSAVRQQSRRTASNPPGKTPCRGLYGDTSGSA